MTPAEKLRLCLIANLALLAMVLGLSFVYGSDSAYWRTGWHDDLMIVSVVINTSTRYVILLGVITILNWGQVLINELGMPILGFSVYNPDKKVITEFTKNELQFYANAMYVISGIRNVFTVLLTISQIDLAIINVITAEMASVVTIRILLNEKEFRGTHEAYEEEMTDMV